MRSVLFFIILTVVSSYTFNFQSQCKSRLLFSSRKNIDYSFRSLESDPHIVFLEYVLYTRMKEYRENYSFSEKHAFSEIFENINKYVLYPLNEDDFYKEVEDEIVIDEEDGFNEFSLEMYKKNQNDEDNYV